MDSEVGEDMTQQIGVVEEAVDVVRRAIFSSYGQRTIGCE